jgi:hypothetical protein
MSHPKISYESFIEELTSNDYIPTIRSEYQTINVCISGGGMADMYVSGIVEFLCYLEKQQKIKIQNIYGTSAGALVGLFFIWILNNNEFVEDYKMNTSEILNLINNDLVSAYKKNAYVIENWIEMIEKRIPPNLYTFCNDKLYITIHVFENYRFNQRTIHQYNSNNELLNILKCSGTIPFITINRISTLIENNQSNPKTFLHGFDGIYPEIIDNQYQTLNINLFNHHYSMLDRMTIKDSGYDKLMFDGLCDIFKFFHKLSHDDTHNLYDEKQIISFKKPKTNSETNSKTNPKTNLISKIININNICIIGSVCGLLYLYKKLQK